MQDSLSLADRGLSLVLLLAIAAGGFFAMDHLIQPEAPRAAAANQPPTGPNAALKPFHAGKRRMFIFLIDSLRYQTAASHDHMPNLIALRARGTYARMQTAHDAVTVPALRAAFTGKDQVTVFGFVKNFLHGTEKIPSLFTQVKAAGLKTAVWSEGSFKQFGDAVDDRLANDPNPDAGDEGEMERQNPRVLAALEDYLAGRHDLVISHILYSDHVAHRSIVSNPAEYRRQYRVVDRMIKHLDAKIPPDETFVVMGDHGHDEQGRHAVGLDVPTYVWFRGPGYRAGCDLGTIRIQDMRYLAGWGLGLPLAEDYTAGRYPQALVPVGEPPERYAQAAADDATEAEAGVPRRRYGQFYLLLIHLGLLASLWWRGLQIDRKAASPAVSRWLAVASAAVLAVPFWASRSSVAGVILALAAIAIPWRTRKPTVGEIVAALGPVAAGLALTHWGLMLMHIRVVVHEPEFTTIALIWLVVLIVGAVAARFLGPMPTAWFVLAVPGLLLYPTVYRYGACVAMGPAWICWALFLISAAARQRGLVALWRTDWRPLAGAGALVFLLIPFCLGEGNNFVFQWWYNPLLLSPATWALAGAWKYTLLISLLAKVLIFAPRSAANRQTAIGAAGGAALAVALLMAVQWWLPLTQGNIGLTVLAGGMLVGALALHRLAKRFDQARPFVRTACIAGLWLTTRALIRTGDEATVWLDVFFAATRLSAWLAAHLGRGRWAMASYPLLGLLAATAVGWGTLAWTVHRLEWHFLYDGLAAGTVEDNVAIFAPAIILRYLLPMLIMRMLLAEFLQPAAPYPRRRITRYAGIKLLSLVFIALGMGMVHAGSDIYFEAVQETALWAVLMLAVL